MIRGGDLALRDFTSELGASKYAYLDSCCAAVGLEVVGGVGAGAGGLEAAGVGAAVAVGVVAAVGVELELDGGSEFEPCVSSDLRCVCVYEVYRPDGESQSDDDTDLEESDDESNDSDDPEPRNDSYDPECCDDARDRDESDDSDESDDDDDDDDLDLLESDVLLAPATRTTPMGMMRGPRLHEVALMIIRMTSSSMKTPKTMDSIEGFVMIGKAARAVVAVRALFL